MLEQGCNGGKEEEGGCRRGQMGKGKEDMANAWLALVCPEAGHFLSLTRGETII